MVLHFLIIILVVGFVTAGLKIRFDRFFTILMLMFVMKKSIFESVNIFLWVIMLGALMIIIGNRNKIAQLPKEMKKKMFVVIPAFTFLASLLGSLLFVNSSNKVLLITLGVLAIIFGLRLAFIHFKKHELEYTEGHPVITKLCGLLGPWISGFSIGFIGTSLKPLKIPFAIKVGKMNIQKVYLGNVITTFFASSFAIMWHYILSKETTISSFLDQMILGVSIWAGIHVVFIISEKLFNAKVNMKWQKVFQIVIGVALIFASIKIFRLI